jgi:hypothetical protein
MPLHVSSTCAHRQEVKIVLYSLWYHHTYRWPSRAQVESGLTLPQYFSNTQFNTFLPFTPSLKLPSHFLFFDQNSVCISHLLHMQPV